MKLQERPLECGMRLVRLLELRVLRDLRIVNKRSARRANTRRGRQIALSAYLTVRPGLSQRRDAKIRPRRGDYLYDEGEDSSAFYVVLSGSLKDLGNGVIKSDGEVLGFDDYSLTRPRHAAVVALDRVVAVIFNQRTLDAIGRRDAHVLSTIVRAAASSGHDQL